VTLVYLGVGWFLGLAAAVACPLKWPVWLALSPLPTAAALLQRHDRRGWRPYLALAFVFLGAARYGASRPHLDSADLGSYNDQGWGEFEGYVAAEPDPRGDLTRLTVMVDWMALEGEAPRRVSGRVLLEAPRYPVLRYGDRLRFAGRLVTPPEGDGFSYRAYLARQRIYSLVRQPLITQLDGRSGSPIERLLLDLKAHAQTIVEQILPDPEASLLSGILLGNDQGIPSRLLEDFNDTGTSHIIAISGYNFSIITSMLFRRLRAWMPPRRAGALALAIIIAYTVLVGASAGVVRAAIMGGLLVVGGMLGRRPFLPASLMAAGISMTAVNPLVIDDVGFQLSFAATWGLVLYAEPLERRTLAALSHLVNQRWAERLTRWLSEALLLTIAAQITTLPLVIYHFGRLSLVSLLTNLLILLVQPPLMALGGLATAAGLLFLPLGQVAAWLSFPFLWWTIRAVEATARFPGASIEANLSRPGLVATYAIIAGLTWMVPRLGGSEGLRRGLTARLALTASLAAAATSLLLAISLMGSLPDGRLHVAFLDVGEGEAILVQTPSGRHILVDGGPDPALLRSHLGRELSFWRRSLDLVIATHPDGAHVNGLPAAMASYRIGALITNGQTDGPTAWEEMLALAERAGIPVVTAVRGQTITTGDGVTLEVLHPGDRLAEGSDDNSIVLQVRYGDATFLLTGDAGQEVEATLIEADLPLQSTVLKAADSGDREGTSQPFLEAVDPWIVVFSLGDASHNPNHHPAERVLERVAGMGCAVGRTDLQGTIRFVTDGQRLWVATDK
jgi:competence protein ComEC